jgi:tripeptidyl-peptidase-1
MLLLQLSAVGLLSTVSAFPTSNYVVHEERSEQSKQLLKRGSSVHPDAILPVSYVLERRQCAAVAYIGAVVHGGTQILTIEQIKIGLKQDGLDAGYDRVMEISHPSSPNYGNYLTADEVDELFQPSHDTVAAVLQWLSEAANIPHDKIQLSNNGWLAVDLPVHAAEKAFRTTYHEHEDKAGRLRIGCDSYSLPAHLAGLVDYVTPGVKSSPPLRKRSEPRWGHGPFPGWHPPHRGPGDHNPWHMPPAAQQLPPDLQDCGRNITPTCIRALYDIPRAHLSDSVNTLGIFEEGDHYSQADLNLFFAQYAPYVPQGTHPTADDIDGAEGPVAQNSPLNTGESDIDFDMAFSLIYPQKTILYQVDDAYYAADGNITGFFNTFLDALDGSYCTYSAYGETGDAPGIDPTYPDPNPGGYKGNLECGVYAPTRVISVSYGEAEADVPAYYQYRQCNEIMKLVLQGHTIVLASGDYGVASFPSDPAPHGCLSADGQNGTIYNPDFTSSCPYILSVGGTQLYAYQTVLDRESAMQDNLGPGAELFASAGGFSNRYKAPSYQQAAVDTYFARHDPGHPYYIAGPNGTGVGANGGIYNRAGRGFPDVRYLCFHKIALSGLGDTN